MSLAFRKASNFSLTKQDPLSVTMVSGRPNCANNILNLVIVILDVDADTLNACGPSLLYTLSVILLVTKRRL